MNCVLLASIAGVIGLPVPIVLRNSHEIFLWRYSRQLIGVGAFDHQSISWPGRSWGYAQGAPFPLFHEIFASYDSAIGTLTFFGRLLMYVDHPVVMESSYT